MEQWISDSFYSFFPSLNDEKNKEREQMIRRQRLEYQDYIKKISNDNIAVKDNNENENSVPITSRSDNTEMEIIVNNPNYEIPRSTDTRPGSTKHRLLQDLKHTGLAKMMFEDGIQSRNQENIENENRKKKEYQKELMRQIEEKRKEIEILKLSEKAAEEATDKKLEKQQKTERTRFELEQNKLIQNRLLVKLQNDIEDSSTAEKLNDTPKESSNQNDVYKFFKNSGTFRKNNHQHSIPLKEKSQINNNLPTKECFHADQRPCPYCNMKSLFCKNCNNDFFKNENENCRMFCKNCESQYFMCLVCDKDKECCNFCQRKKNVCIQCILNYCVHCGNPMNSRKTLEDISERNVNIGESKNVHQSFKILDDHDTDNEDIENIDDEIYFLNHKNHFSTNIDKRSLFHPDYNLEDSKYELNIPENDNGFQNFDDADNFDILRKKTNEKLLKYIKNYGDLPRKKLVKDKSEKPYIRLMEPILQPQQKFSTIRSNRMPDNLTNRSEIPNEANSSLTTNPFVITQLGAMRRQLNLDRLKNDHVIK